VQVSQTKGLFIPFGPTKGFKNFKGFANRNPDPFPSINDPPHPTSLSTAPAATEPLQDPRAPRCESKPGKQWNMGFIFSVLFSPFYNPREQMPHSDQIARLYAADNHPLGEAASTIASTNNTSRYLDPDLTQSSGGGARVSGRTCSVPVCNCPLTMAREANMGFS